MVNQVNSTYKVKVPALWGAAPRILPLPPGSTRSCSSSCSSCDTSVPVPPVIRAAPKVRIFQAPSRCPGTLHTVDLSEEEEATLASMTVPAQRSQKSTPKSSVIFGTKGKLEEQKDPTRAAVQPEDLGSLQERAAQEKELERDARMQSIIFQRREQDLTLACQPAAGRPEAIEARPGLPQGPEKAIPSDRREQVYLKISIACKASQASERCNEVGPFPNAASARSSRSSVSQPNLLHGMETNEDGRNDTSWITPCLAEEDCPRSRPNSAGSGTVSTLRSRSTTPSSQVAGSTQRWMISISKDEVEAVQDEHAESFHEQDTAGKDMRDVFEQEVGHGELLPSEETASADLPAEADEQEETSHEEAVPMQDMDEDEDAESSHTEAEETASADLPAEADEQEETSHEEAMPMQDMDEDEDAESSHTQAEETASADLPAEADEKEDEDAESSHTQAEETVSADLPAETDEKEDEDGESSDSDSEEDSDSDDSSDSDSSSSSSSESAQSEEESASPTTESCPNEAFEGLCSNVAEGTAMSGNTELESPAFEEPETKIPELSATTLWRNKILGRVEAPHLQRIAKNVVRQELPSPASPPPPRRIVELSSSPGTDALVSLRLSAKELAREKLKMLQQCRAEGHKLLDSSKIHQASMSLPQLKMGAKLRGPGLWEVSQVPQASAHFAKLGKAMPKQATQVRGSKNNHVKASMTESRSLPSISATPSQFGVGAQKQVLQARFGEKRSLDR